MTIKIDKKIVGHKLKIKNDPEKDIIVNTQLMHENIRRSEILQGSTYKIKPNNTGHAIYVTINNIILNANSPEQEIRPYEIFINSKNVDHYQWSFALTRVISAVFRKGGEVKFLADELKETFDPKGGYFKKNIFMPSIVAEIGHVLETHLKSINMIIMDVDIHREEYLTAKRTEHTDASGNIKNAIVCPKCSVVAMVNLDNCKVCLSCGESSCG